MAQERFLKGRDGDEMRRLFEELIAERSEHGKFEPAG